jgi:hypothetical protein
MRETPSEIAVVSRYDEMHAAGAIRPHWQRLIEALAQMPAQDYARRQTSAQATIRENGVTYNVYDDVAGRARPWQLDIVPFVVSVMDWQTIEAAVIQRARLTDAILADIYGSQKLIAEGHMPPRYVSGYLLTQPSPGPPRLLGADASHAWFSVWAPPYGWVDLDPTNNLLPSDEHITLAWGRDYADVAPINGIVTGGGDHVIEVGVDVLPMERL